MLSKADVSLSLESPPISGELFDRSSIYKESVATEMRGNLMSVYS